MCTHEIAINSRGLGGWRIGKVTRVYEKVRIIGKWYQMKNKLAKARKLRKPGTISLKKFGLGNLWVKKVFTGQKSFSGQKMFF